MKPTTYGECRERRLRRIREVIVTDNSCRSARTELLLAVFLLASVMPAGATETEPKVTTAQDRFTGVTTIATKDALRLGIEWEPMVNFYASYRSIGFDGAPYAPQLSIHVTFSWSTWRYLKCSQTRWLADGRPVELPMPQHDGEVLDGGKVIETLVIGAVAMSDLGRLATARKIEMKVCTDVFTFTDLQAANLRELWRRLQPSQ